MMKYGKFQVTVKEKDTEIVMSCDGLEFEVSDVIEIAKNNLVTLITMVKGFLKFQKEIRADVIEWAKVLNSLENEFGVEKCVTCGAINSKCDCAHGTVA